jgi:hypothetical protein
VAGYGDFLRGRQTQAQSFLSSGNLNYNPLPVAGSNTTGCNDSTDCASGWACIGGVCVKEESSSEDGSGNLSGCGGGGTPGGQNQCGAGTGSFLTLDKDLADFDRKVRANLKVGDVLVLEGINGGSVGDGEVGLSLNGKCLKTGCSGSATPLGTNGACCGQGRCCRMGSVVQCFCGECPPPPQRCSQFCTSYLSANGSSAAGCSSENTCDECSFCTDLGNFAGTTCIPKGGSGPCWCGKGVGRNCTICEKCGGDGTCESDRGNCYPSYPEGPTPDPDPDPGSSDPCAGTCATVTVCDDEPDPDCPPRSSCRQSGDITVGSRNCRLFEQCDKSDVPPECEFCDCNCNNDCPNCQLCGANGKCAPDPACEGYFAQGAVAKQTCRTGFTWAIEQDPENRCNEPTCPGTANSGYSVSAFKSGKIGTENPDLTWFTVSTTPSSCSSNGCPEISLADWPTVIAQVKEGGTPVGFTIRTSSVNCPGSFSSSIGLYRSETAIITGFGSTQAEANSDYSQRAAAWANS